MLDYRLRQATDADYDFLYRLHVAAMRDLVTQVWGWEDARQEQFFADHFDPAYSRIVVVDGVDVGVIAVEWGAADAFLANIEILPEYQGRGLGAAIIGGVIAETDARRLYERLGFVVTGQTETHFLMTKPLQ